MITEPSTAVILMIGLFSLVAVLVGLYIDRHTPSDRHGKKDKHCHQ